MIVCAAGLAGYWLSGRAMKVIRTTSEVILERDRSTEQYREMVEQILRESESASALIEQLLTLARADAETEQLSFERVDLRALLEELDPGNRAFAANHDLHWFSEIPREPILVDGDRPHLRRLLLILIDNACRYTEMGGSIRLRLTSEQEDAIVEVADTGIGIPVDELKKYSSAFIVPQTVATSIQMGPGWVCPSRTGSQAPTVVR